MRFTSREAYADLVARGLLGERQREAYAALREHGPCTAQELERKAKVPRSTYGRRLSELPSWLVQETGKRPCGVTGRTAIVWKALPPPTTPTEIRAAEGNVFRAKQQALFAERNTDLRALIDDRRSKGL